MKCHAIHLWGLFDGRQDTASRDQGVESAASRTAHRFEQDERSVFDDGWSAMEDRFPASSLPLPTVVAPENARSALSLARIAGHPFRLWA